MSYSRYNKIAISTLLFVVLFGLAESWTESWLVGVLVGLAAAAMSWKSNSNRQLEFRQESTHQGMGVSSSGFATDQCASSFQNSPVIVHGDRLGDLGYGSNQINSSTPAWIGLSVSGSDIGSGSFANWDNK